MRSIKRHLPVWVCLVCLLMVCWGPLTNIVASNIGKPGGGNYQTVEDEGVALTQRPILNFTGNAVSCADNVPNTRSDCTIAGATAAYGSIYALDNATATVISVINTWVQFTDFTAVGPSQDTTPSLVSDDITIDITGVFEVVGSVSFSGGANSDYQIKVAKNNGATDLTNCLADRLLGAGGDVGSVSISCLSSLTATDTVELWVRNTTNTNNLTLEQVDLSVLQPGSGGGGGGELDVAKMTRAAAQSIPGAAALTKIAFDTVTFDLGTSITADATTNDRFDINADGHYLVSCSWGVTDLSAAAPAISLIYVNGASVRVGEIRSSNNLGDNTVPVEDLLALSNGDFVEFYVQQADTGGAMNTDTTIQRRPSMFISKLR